MLQEERRMPFFECELGAAKSKGPREATEWARELEEVETKKEGEVHHDGGGDWLKEKSTSTAYALH